MTPAGFWRRYAAWSLDAALLLPLFALVAGPRTAALWRGVGQAMTQLAQVTADALQAQLLAGTDPATALATLLQAPALLAASQALAGQLGLALGLPLAVFAALMGAWQVAFEASRWHATPGKRCCALRVQAQGRAPSPARALLRNAAGSLSWLTLNAGHALALLPPRHRALHDWIADADVVLAPGVAPRLPAGARAWLALQALLATAALVAGVAWLQRLLEHALQLPL